MARYRLKSGVHVDANGRYDSKDPNNNIITTETDLCGKFPRRFEKLAESESAVAVAVRTGAGSLKAIPATVPASEDGRELKFMTVSELQRLAEELEVDLGEATKKREIVKILEESGA